MAYRMLSTPRRDAKCQVLSARYVANENTRRQYMRLFRLTLTPVLVIACVVALAACGSSSKSSSSGGGGGSKAASGGGGAISTAGLADTKPKPSEQHMGGTLNVISNEGW